jgi:beta-lactamase class A
VIAVPHGCAIGVALAMMLGGDLAGLAPEWARIEKESGGTLGAAARIVETGETIAVAGDGHFQMQSVCKAPIAMAVLH